MRLTKRRKLHLWLIKKRGWVYLREVPYLDFGMTRAHASSALSDFCATGRADFRIVGLKQYKAKE